MSSWCCVGGMGPHLPPPQHPAPFPPPPKWEGAGSQEGMGEGFGGHLPQDPQVGLSLGALGGGLWDTPPMGSWGGGRCTLSTHPLCPGGGGCAGTPCTPGTPPSLLESPPPAPQRPPYTPSVQKPPPPPHPNPPTVYQTPPPSWGTRVLCTPTPLSPEDPHGVLEPPPAPQHIPSPPTPPPVYRTVSPPGIPTHPRFTRHPLPESRSPSCSTGPLPELPDTPSSGSQPSPRFTGLPPGLLDTPSQSPNPLRFTGPPPVYRLPPPGITGPTSVYRTPPPEGPDPPGVPDPLRFTDTPPPAPALTETEAAPPRGDARFPRR